MRLFRFAIPLVLLGASMLVALPAAAFAQHASGFYDHQLINYEATAQVTSSPQAAQQISLGNIVYHVVDPNGNVPAVQCARLLAAFPNLSVSEPVDRLQRAELHSDRGRLQWWRVESPDFPLESRLHPS